uniref:EGF-like domain-containing protein n=1 Tax=Gongylonema pulchrum TaxID=637853 RepID=A0A183DC60_9BILA
LLSGGCSTRSRYEQKKVAPSHRFADLEDCKEAYWGYCRNGGICKMTTDISKRAVPACSCPAGFRGRQCELISDPNIYFSRQQGQMEMAAMSSLLLAIVFALLFASFVLYFYRRYMKYGMRTSSSLSTLDTLELSPSDQQKARNPEQNTDDLKKKMKRVTL